MPTEILAELPAEEMGSPRINIDQLWRQERRGKGDQPIKNTTVTQCDRGHSASALTFLALLS
jgi:hypothetical protein